MIHCTVTSCKQTEILGSILAELASPGDILTLAGQLGTGKTTLTQAIATGLGIENKYVTSPSFAILHEYQGRLPLYHFDFYRLGESTEIEEQGFSEYFYKKGLCVIEWADLAKEFLPQNHLSIIILYNQEKSNYRDIKIDGSFYKENCLYLLQEKISHSGIIISHKQ